MACCKDTWTNVAEKGMALLSTHPSSHPVGLCYCLLITVITFLNFAVCDFYGCPFPLLYRQFTEMRSVF